MQRISRDKAFSEGYRIELSLFSRCFLCAFAPLRELCLGLAGIGVDFAARSGYFFTRDPSKGGIQP